MTNQTFSTPKQGLLFLVNACLIIAQSTSVLEIFFDVLALQVIKNPILAVLSLLHVTSLIDFMTALPTVRFSFRRHRF